MSGTLLLLRDPPVINGEKDKKSFPGAQKKWDRELNY
jgi:hypothetical protein